MNGCATLPGFEAGRGEETSIAGAATRPPVRWRGHRAIEGVRFNDAASAVYRFV